MLRLGERAGLLCWSLVYVSCPRLPTVFYNDHSSGDIEADDGSTSGFTQGELDPYFCLTYDESCGVWRSW